MDFGNGMDSRPADRIVPPVREIYRYLGYRNQQPDEQVQKMVDDVCRILVGAANPKAFYRIYPMELSGTGVIRIDSAEIDSRNLALTLKGCSRVILLAATLGHEVDTRLRLLGKTDVTRQVILQSAAAAYLEAYLDVLQSGIRSAAAQDGWYIRPRFSPGYGDFGLEYQTWIAAELELQKRLGIVLSGSLMMVPSKSVTALIGVSRQDIRCLHNGCESCEKKDCAFRRQ